MDLWAPTAFEYISKHGETDPSVADERPTYLALGEVVVAEGYLLLKATICNNKFKRVGISMDTRFSFPHMTLAKLLFDPDSVQDERKVPDSGDTLWCTAGGLLNMTAMVEDVNLSLKSQGVLFKFIPVNVEKLSCRWRYNVIGGEGLAVFCQIQDEICRRCNDGLGKESIEKWSCPHITFCYEPQYCSDCLHGDGHRQQAPEVDAKSESTLTALAPAVEQILCQCNFSEKKLKEFRIKFQKAGVAFDFLPKMDHDSLQEIGIDGIGYRQRILDQINAQETENMSTGWQRHCGYLRIL